jgi:hypothetical protein
LWFPNDHPLWGPFRYVEVARWRPDTGAVAREQDHDHNPIILTVDEVEAWRERRGNLGLYTSVWQYDSHDVANGQRVASMYFDLDDHGAEDNAQKNARTLVAYLSNFVSEDAIRIYFTGQKGFHVEVELIALGIGVVDGLAGLYRYVATGVKELLDLPSVDFHVYDPRRIWRLPNSQHQVTGLYKVPLSVAELEYDLPIIWELALEPRPYVVPDQRFEPHANEWLREWMFKRFTQHGARPTDMQVPHLTGASAQRLLESQLKCVITAAEGARNHTLNRATFILKKAGVEPWTKVEDSLLDAALKAGLEERESRRTISSAITAVGREDAVRA